MFANKLKHTKPAFAAVRGAVAWMVLMGVSFLYPHIQRSHYRAKARVEQPAKDTSFVVANGAAEPVAPALKQPATMYERASFEPRVTGGFGEFFKKKQIEVNVNSDR